MRVVIIILTVVTTFAVHGYGPYSGTVHNSDGEPIANVSVTDGRNVVKTDKDGNFTLKGWNKTHFITVTVPAGYQTDDYYIPVERKKKSYDFVLEKSDVTAQEDHCFIQISDTEIGEKGTGEWLDGVNDGYIYTLDLKTGKEINSKFAGSAVLGKEAITDSYIYAGTFDGCAVCFEK